MRFLREEFPHLVAGYERLYPGAYAPKPYTEAVRTLVHSLQERYDLRRRRRGLQEATADDADESATTFGFRYDTLEGHIERGSEWFVVRKDHASGAIRFAIASRWREGDFPNLWSRIGFAVLADRYRLRWLERAMDRMRSIAAHGHP